MCVRDLERGVATPVEIFELVLQDTHAQQGAILGESFIQVPPPAGIAFIANE